MQDGLVLLDKPPGKTSFEALTPVKRGLRTGKVGHAGTLDRFGSGLLVVLTGKMTRLIRAFADTEKHYTATILFGTETETLDPEGGITARGEVPAQADLEGVLRRFVGTIEQVPPAYSAVHVDGERAYERARSGRAVSPKARHVVVHEIELLRYQGAEAEISLRCGSGTYVRSLARDIAYELGTVSHVVRLRRTGIGDFGVDESIRPDDFDPDKDMLPPKAVADRLPGVATAVVSTDALRGVAHGAPLSPGDFERPPAEEGITLVTSRTGNVVAAVERNKGRFKYVFVAAGQEETA
jgi:tRNA pseudouridine55 synthase